MAPRIKSPCREPACGAICAEAYCDKHRHAKEKRRGTSHSRGYGRRHQRMRTMVLSEEPFCLRCRAQGIARSSVVMDHIVPKSQGGTDERSNLQGLCVQCHNRKTIIEDGGHRV